MKNIRYIIADPTKNITALVGTQVEPASRPFVASRIMEAEPLCEQVGFVGRNAAGEYFLGMAGGEFCGNASLSAAALFCAETGLLPGETREVLLRVSGAAAPVPVTITAKSADTFSGTVRMPDPERIGEVRLSAEGEERVLPAVFFPGIAHIIVTEAMTEERAEGCVRRWCGELSQDALGIMLFDEAARTLKPLVYVPAADTLFWESSCASGTSAVGAYLAAKTGRPVSIDVAEPGGVLRVAAGETGITLSGNVTIGPEKTMTV